MCIRDRAFTGNGHLRQTVHLEGLQMIHRVVHPLLQTGHFLSGGSGFKENLGRLVRQTLGFLDHLFDGLVSLEPVFGVSDLLPVLHDLLQFLDLLPDGVRALKQISPENAVSLEMCIRDSPWVVRPNYYPAVYRGIQ